MSFTRPYASARRWPPGNRQHQRFVSNCRRMRERSAPIADGRQLVLTRRARASSRIETFPQPISNNSATAESRRINVPPIDYELIVQSF